jgi:hypothetical protein
MLSSGKGYDNYGLNLSAATLVPLQGFWNNFVYIRPRYLRNIIYHVGSSIRRASSLFHRSSKPEATERSASESLQQSASHDQLHVVQVNENAFMSVSVEECNNPMASTKQETDDNTIEKTLKDSHVSKSGGKGGGHLNGLSHFGNDLNATKERVKDRRTSESVNKQCYQIHSRRDKFIQ